MSKKLVIGFVMTALLFLAGCEAKLSDKKAEFSSSSYVYQFQLPSTWEERAEADFQGEFGARAIFAAEDKQSKSQMFIQASSKESVDLTNFGESTRENLQKIYSYSNVDDIYMTDYEVNGNQVFKYTLNGDYKDESVWVHSYYVITDEEVLEIVFYSADDNRYEDRVKIIDKSVDTLKEKEQKEQGAETSSSIVETEESKAMELSKTAVENEQMTINVTGYRKIVVDDQAYLAVRFTMMNNGDEEIRPLLWYEKAKVKQGDTVLEQTEFPDSDEAGNLKLLAEDNTKSLQKGESSAGLAFYSLLSKGENTAYVEFLAAEFEQKEPIGFDLSAFD